MTRPVLTITLMNPSAMIQSDREADVNYMLMVAGKEGEPFNEKLGAYLDQGAVKEYANYWNQNWENLTLFGGDAAIGENWKQGYWLRV